MCLGVAFPWHQAVPTWFFLSCPSEVQHGIQPYGMGYQEVGISGG